MKVLPQVTILYSKPKSFPLQMFSDIWYSLEQRNTMVSPSLHPLGDLNIMAY